MILAIASGKGGTGKTTLAVAFAQAAPTAVTYLDCDVEEPNGNLFLKSQLNISEDVTVKVPVIDDQKCNHCRECALFCEFNAISSLPKITMVFPELCHNCGGCARVCPTGAISEENFIIGSIEKGETDHIETIQGKLKIGRAMAPPIIRAVKKHTSANGLTVIDCPPGTSCPVIAAVKGVDYTVLVTEPTPFGLHDLVIAVETMQQLNMPFGVIINRADVGDNRVVAYCNDNDIPILLKINNSRKIAEAYSSGQTLLDAAPELKEELRSILATIRPETKSITKEKQQ